MIKHTDCFGKHHLVKAYATRNKYKKIIMYIHIQYLYECLLNIYI